MKLAEGQVAVVTGAASGIGFGLASAFHARGLSVVLADVESERLAQARASLGDDTRTLAVRTDVSQAAEVAALADAALARFGRVDVICNNAGVMSAWRAAWELDADIWKRILDVNLGGTINGIRVFVPLLLAQGAGHVVNTASIGGLRPRPGQTPYTVSKQAIVGLSECLQLELEALNSEVGVTVVCPGPVATRMTGQAGDPRPELNDPGAPPKDDKDFWVGPRAQEPEFQSPSDVAEMVLSAVEENRLYLLPTPGTAALARARVERLLAAIADTA